MIEVIYNGHTIENWDNLNDDAEHSIRFLYNKFYPILGYYENEINNAGGKLIIECNQTRKSVKSTFRYENMPYEIIEKIKSRL